jgi:2-desacetyl-2-hydroxyethyl bacteriochlorophyllide A dehydrogenase
VIHARGQVSVETVDDPTPGRREVVVEVAACGICGTDLHILDGEFAPTLPVIPGHEFSGRVVALGTDVTELAVGDPVAVDPSVYCNECHFCRQGRNNLCDRWAAIGVTMAGGAAEYAAVGNCFKLPDGIRLEDAALIEPLSCAVRGYDVLPRRLAEHYLIYGAGTMGLMMLQLARRAGAATVSVVDTNAARLDTAKLLGATSVATSAAGLGHPLGWEVVIDCTGVVAAIEDGLTRVRKGGSFLQFGVSEENAKATFSPYRIYNEEITILGSMAVLHSFERAGELFAGGALDADAMITHRLPLEEYPAALAAFQSGQGLKTQVLPKAADTGMTGTAGTTAQGV